MGEREEREVRERRGEKQGKKRDGHRDRRRQRERERVREGEEEDKERAKGTGEGGLGRSRGKGERRREEQKREGTHHSFTGTLGLHFWYICARNLKLNTSSSFTNAWYWWSHRTIGISPNCMSRWNRGPSLILSGVLEQLRKSFAWPLTGWMMYSTGCPREDIVLAVMGCCQELTAAFFSSMAFCGERESIRELVDSLCTCRDGIDKEYGIYACTFSCWSLHECVVLCRHLLSTWNQKTFDFQWPLSLQLILVLFHSFFTFTMITTNHTKFIKLGENLLFIHNRN